MGGLHLEWPSTTTAFNNAISRIAGLIAIAFTGVIVGGAIDFDGFRHGAYVVAALFAVAGLISWAGIRNDECDYRQVSAKDAAGCRDRAAPPPVYVDGEG